MIALLPLAFLGALLAIACGIVVALLLMRSNDKKQIAALQLLHEIEDRTNTRLAEENATLGSEVAVTKVMSNEAERDAHIIEDLEKENGRLMGELETDRRRITELERELNKRSRLKAPVDKAKISQHMRNAQHG